MLAKVFPIELNAGNQAETAALVEAFARSARKAETACQSYGCVNGSRGSRPPSAVRRSHDRKLIRHPLVGDLDLRYEPLRLTGDDDQLLITYTAKAGSPTAEALRQLAGWSLVEVAGGQVPEGP